MVKQMICPMLNFTSVINYRSKMNIKSIKILALGVLTAIFILLNIFKSHSAEFKVNDSIALNANETLKQETFEILEAKCNSCHRKKNPFMVFSIRNMERRAPKIHEQVFITKRMPKGDQMRLTNNEYSILKKWLTQQNIN